LIPFFAEVNIKFDLSPELKALKSGISAFFKKECSPELEAMLDSGSRFPSELYKKDCRQ
jgi:hypothetical protein